MMISQCLADRSAATLLRDLEFIAFPCGQSGRFAVLACSLDESSDGECKKVFAVGGFIAHLANWFEAERLWKKRLEKDGIAYFRAVDCQNIRGPFTEFRSDRKSLKYVERLRAEKVRDDLIDILRATGMMGFCVGIDMHAYDALKRTREGKRQLGSTPYHLAYQLAMTQAAGILDETETCKGEVLAFVCDEHEEYAAHTKNTYDELKRKNPSVAEKMGTLTYADDRKTPALQMADLMAFEAMHKSLAWFRGSGEERPAFVRLKDIVYKIELCMKDSLTRIIAANQPTPVGDSRPENGQLPVASTSQSAAAAAAIALSAC